ncbi:MAG: BTAD domain-containing putative transcriptional regulator, partial [Chloroflexota bacterium]
MLYIHLYGRLQLFYHERPFTFTAPPKTLPLWVYLLLHRTQPVSRDTLAFTLWPDVLETRARANLRRHLHQLQQALPPPVPDKPWLVREAGTLQWNPAAGCWLDVAEFERLSGVADYLSKAVALYSGDLLPELDEAWLLPHRERLRNQFFANLSRLIARCQAQRNQVQAIAYAQQALTHDPLREEMV